MMSRIGRVGSGHGYVDMFWVGLSDRSLELQIRSGRVKIFNARPISHSVASRIRAILDQNHK